MTLEQLYERRQQLRKEQLEVATKIRAITGGNEGKRLDYTRLKDVIAFKFADKRWFSYMDLPDEIQAQNNPSFFTTAFMRLKNEGFLIHNGRAMKASKYRLK